MFLSPKARQYDFVLRLDNRKAGTVSLQVAVVQAARGLSDTTVKKTQDFSRYLDIKNV